MTQAVFSRVLELRAQGLAMPEATRQAIAEGCTFPSKRRRPPSQAWEAILRRGEHATRRR